MATYFFDSSVVVKNYHAEAGTARVHAILASHGHRFVISRLTMDVTSALAKKVRVGKLTASEFKRTAQRFRKDVARKHWGVVNVLVPRCRVAERMLRRVALQHNLRALDAIQLAVALSLHSASTPITFVCADQALCTIAAAEGLAVINPELP